MEFKYYLFLAKKSFFNKKINIINTLLLIISTIMIVFVLSFYKTFNSIIDNSLNNDINHRILLVHNVDNNLDLSKMDNVSFQTSFDHFSKYVNTENNDSLVLIGVPDNYLEVNFGQNLFEVEDKNVMICPTRFYLGKDPEKFDQDFLDRLHNGKDYINKSFVLQSDNYEENYKIIGLYDVNKYTYGEYHNCFTRQSNIIDIANAELEYMKQECNDDEQNCDNITSSGGTALLVLKDVNRIDETKRLLQQQGYVVTPKASIVKTEINFFIIIVAVMIVGVIIMTFTIMFIYNKKSMQYNKKNNLIYKALGYNDNILIRINYLESIILSIVSSIISIIVCCIIYVALNHIFAVDIEIANPIYVSYFSFILSFVISLIISFLSIYFAINKNNNSIIEDFADEEI